MPFYLVERYVPSMTMNEVRAAVNRLGDGAHVGVRHVWTGVVSGEDTCLSVVEAPDSAVVERANTAAAFDWDRIVEIALIEVGA